MTDDREPVEVEGVIVIQTTERAIRVLDADDRRVWVPRSHIDDDSEVYDDGHEGTLTVSAWLAEKEGW